jgi:hypothetical protein
VPEDLSVDARRLRRQRAHHHHRDGLEAQRLVARMQELPPGAERHHQVEQDERRQLALVQTLQGGAAVLGLDHREALVGEYVDDGIA